MDRKFSFNTFQILVFNYSAGVGMRRHLEISQISIVTKRLKILSKERANLCKKSRVFREISEIKAEFLDCLPI